MGKKISQLEYNYNKLVKHTNTLYSLSALALVLGIIIGVILLIAASGIMFGMFVAMGIFIILASIIYYNVSRYFVYMGEGMLSLMHKLLDEKAAQKSESTE